MYLHAKDIYMCHEGCLQYQMQRGFQPIHNVKPWDVIKSWFFNADEHNWKKEIFSIC